MLTATLITLTAVLFLALAVMVTVYLGSLDHITQLEDLVKAKCAELDALSIAGPPVDTRTGSHDRLPIREDIRHTLIDYCEGMWHQPTSREKP